MCYSFFFLCYRVCEVIFHLKKRRTDIVHLIQNSYLMYSLLIILPLTTQTLLPTSKQNSITMQFDDNYEGLLPPIIPHQEGGQHNNSDNIQPLTSPLRFTYRRPFDQPIAEYDRIMQEFQRFDLDDDTVHQIRFIL